jgi:hypothetical protein
MANITLSLTVLICSVGVLDDTTGLPDGDHPPAGSLYHDISVAPTLVCDDDDNGRYGVNRLGIASTDGFNTDVLYNC